MAGAAFPFLAGLFSLTSFSNAFLVLSVFFFMSVAFVAWQAVVKLTAYLHAYRGWKQAVFFKLVRFSIGGALAGAAVFLVATVGWQVVALPAPNTFSLWKAAAIGAAGGLLLSLYYEVVFLSIEKEQDNRVLLQIDRERQQAEISVLKNELDPHFFFNCMNTLSHLVRSDSEKAYQFVHKLSSVYKYFLRNKEKEQVPLQDELEFLDDYYFLLRIRYDNNIRIVNDLPVQQDPLFVLPCSLQVLVENAIKHNFFSEKEPLEIFVEQSGSFLVVSNPVRPKMHAVESTWVGLRNLQARYRLFTGQKVIIQKTHNRFLVKLPIVKTNNHDKSSDH